MKKTPWEKSKTVKAGTDDLVYIERQWIYRNSPPILERLLTTVTHYKQTGKFV